MSKKVVRRWIDGEKGGPWARKSDACKRKRGHDEIEVDSNVVEKSGGIQVEEKKKAQPNNATSENGIRSPRSATSRLNLRGSMNLEEVFL